MPLEEIKNSSKVIGIKQVKKAITKGEASSVYIASDTEPHIGEPLKRLCEQNKVKYFIFDSMDSLGKACGIEVGASAVALIKD